MSIPIILSCLSRGKSAGTTTLTLGNETYTINVNYKQQQVSAVVGETTTIAVSGTPDTTGLDTTIAEVTIANNKMTIKGLQGGQYLCPRRRYGV